MLNPIFHNPTNANSKFKPNYERAYQTFQADLEYVKSFDNVKKGDTFDGSDRVGVVLAYGIGTLGPIKGGYRLDTASEEIIQSSDGVSAGVLEERHYKFDEKSGTITVTNTQQDLFDPWRFDSARKEEYVIDTENGIIADYASEGIGPVPG
jgi:hypothetical protein